MSFSPTGVAGCFLWLDASQIGISSNNTKVTYWPDLSNNNNNFSYASSSSTWSYPTFHTNRLNGYPSVGFSGTNYLQCTNGTSTQLMNQNMAIFAVYSTSGSWNQTLFSNDAPAYSAVDFQIGVGSSLYFGYLNPLGSNTTISAGSSTPLNQYILRADRFRPSNNSFAIEYFGQLVTSGAIGLQNVGTTLMLGYSTVSSFQNYFQGNLVELIAYNNEISESNASGVTSYLQSKYFPGTPTPTPTPSPSPTPPVKQPTDLSGVCLWLRSTSIGVNGPDGSPVQYWKDDSGSGNNVSIDFTQSGTWVTPQFYRNRINGYPTVKFSNGNNYGYLFSQTNSGLGKTAKDFTGFVVFNTNDGYDNQTIYGVANSNGDISFNVELNYNGNGSVDFSTSINNSQNTVTTGKVYDTDSFVIRHDRFRQSDGKFFFGLYGADLTNYSSSLITTNNINSPVLTVGGLYQSSRQFIGEVAEVIVYNRRLSDNETQYVDQYLIQKYMTGNAAKMNLFTYSTAASSIRTSVPLYSAGVNSGSTAQCTLYTGSKLVNNKSTTLYQISIGNPQQTAPLYVQSSVQLYPPISLFLGSNFPSSGVTPLYTASSRYLSNNRTLYMNAEVGQPSSTTTLYVGSHGGVNSGISAYTHGSTTTQKSVNLYTQASVQQFPPLNLYLRNIQEVQPPNLYLYTKGYTNPSKEATTTLFVSASNRSTSGLYKPTNLYLEAGRSISTMSMYVGVEPINTHPSSTMPLYIGQPHITGVFSSSLSLFLSNEVSGINSPIKRLYIRGKGTLVGGSIEVSPGMPLYSFSNSNPHPTPTPTTLSSGIPLHVGGVSTTNNTVLLSVSGKTTSQGNITLYQHGKDSSNYTASMYMPGGTPSGNNNIIMYTRGY